MEFKFPRFLLQYGESEERKNVSAFGALYISGLMGGGRYLGSGAPPIDPSPYVVFIEAAIARPYTTALIKQRVRTFSCGTADSSSIHNSNSQK